MNVLFVMYGDFGGNSAHPMALHARELHALGHACAAAVASNVESIRELVDPRFRPMLYADVLRDPASVFPDGRPADILHAWTPREGVRRFVTQYQSRTPTPWVAYLEDNEEWIARTALAAVRIPPERLLEHSDEVLGTWTPEGMPHPLKFRPFVALADAAAVIQEKLAVEVPPWVPCTTVMPGVDLERFAPRAPDAALRERFGVASHERVIAYPGGLNDFTRPGLETLCRMVGVINARGVPCRLLRSGPVAIDFMERLPPEARAAVTDLGPLPRDEVPRLLALADVLVQPGRHDPFEDLRLPGKLPELFATGRPVVLPDTNIAHLLRDGVDAVVHRTGTPEEMAEKCLELFTDPERARRIGEAGRRFAQAHFDPRVQAKRLLDVFEATRATFDPQLAGALWSGATPDTPLPALLARRLRLMATGGATPRATGRALLESYARYIDFAAARMAGLETGMRVRDETLDPLRRELATLRDEAQSLRHALAERGQEVEAIRASLSWRVTRPLRMVLRLLSRSSRS